ncbi:MAG: hypothetical protein ACRC14_06470 [Paracoccaceae bacterium]
MGLSHHLKGANVVAANVVAANVVAANVVAEGLLATDVCYEALSPQWQAGLIGWKVLTDHEPQPRCRTHKGDPGQGCYSSAVARFWRETLATDDATSACLIYLHCGLHPDPRTPLLPHLLAELGHRGAVHALRVDTPVALNDAMAFAQAMVRRFRRVVVLLDRTERRSATSADNQPGAGEMHYAILSFVEPTERSSHRPAPFVDLPSLHSRTGVADVFL